MITLGPASEEEFKYAKEFFSVLPQKIRLYGIQEQDIDEIYKTIEKAELPVGESGKGRSAWMAYGYILSQHECQAIALHDCDILT